MPTDKEKDMTREDQFIHTSSLATASPRSTLQKLLGAEEGHRMMTPNGQRVLHGELILDQ